jgi:fumarate hydratase subunit alpha
VELPLDDEELSRALQASAATVAVSLDALGLRGSVLTASGSPKRCARRFRAPRARCVRTSPRARCGRCGHRERSERGTILEQLSPTRRSPPTTACRCARTRAAVWVRIELGSEETLTGNVQTEIDAAVASMRIAQAGCACRSCATAARPHQHRRQHAGLRRRRVAAGNRRHGARHAQGRRLGQREPHRDAGSGRRVRGVKRVVLETVEAKATGACPPLLVGVGVGSTFDKVGGLAKRALLREIGTVPMDDPGSASWRPSCSSGQRHGDRARRTGRRHHCALAVHLVTAPCHIAALPVAVNMGCCAVRSASVEVMSREIAVPVAVRRAGRQTRRPSACVGARTAG